MDRFDSPPLPLSPAIRAGEFEAAQLVFYDVDHSGRSFEAAVFLGASDVGPETPLEPEQPDPSSSLATAVASAMSGTAMSRLSPRTPSTAARCTR
jgi:hypothetical protein